MSLSQEQATRIASNVLINDIVTYINTHPQEYENCLNEEYQRGKLSKEQYQNELKIIEKIKNGEVIKCLSILN